MASVMMVDFMINGFKSIVLLQVSPPAFQKSMMSISALYDFRESQGHAVAGAISCNGRYVLSCFLSLSLHLSLHLRILTGRRLAKIRIFALLFS